MISSDMEMPRQAELPFNSEIVTVVLSDRQRDQLMPLVEKQATDRRAVVFVSVAPFWDLDAGETRLRLQAAFLDWKTANKVLKLIRAASLEASTNPVAAH
jgi:hypothetical protein